jgi:hypothetical protein
MTVANPKVEDDQACLDEFVTKDDSISRDLKLAFKENLADDIDEFAQVQIESPIRTKWHDETLGCGLRFQLQAWEKTAQAYVDWEDFVEVIKQEVPNKRLYTDMAFDEHSGYFNAWFSKKDILALLTRFTDGNLISINFRIVTRVVGSQVAGAAISDVTQLVTAEFKVVYVPKAIVEDCSNNKLAKTGLTSANTERANKFTYAIQTKDVAPTILPIPAIKVETKGCSATTVLEFMHPLNGWTEAREKEGHTAFSYDADGTMSVTF